jgi:hypothetical protein
MAGLFEVATTKEEVTKPEIEEPEIAFTIEFPLSAHFSFNSSKNPEGHSQIPFSWSGSYFKTLTDLQVKH